MKFALLLVAVVLALMVFRTLRSSAATRSAPPPAPKKVRGKGPAGGRTNTGSGYRAISVKCGSDACEQALALGKRRFLLGQLQTFPLPGCTSADCQCKFVHHPDRRDGDGDQRAPAGLSSQLYTASGKSERRSRGGRRETDLE